MKLAEVIAPKDFCQWAPTALDHHREEIVAVILTCSMDPDLVEMSRALADSNISEMQALAVLVALEMFLQQQPPKEKRKAVLLEFASEPQPSRASH